MPNIRALRSGNWHDTNSTTSPWGSGGIVFLPTAADDVWLNSFTIILTANPVTRSITNAGVSNNTLTWIYGDRVASTLGGSLNVLGDNITITGNLNPLQPTAREVQGSRLIALTGGTLTVVGNVVGGDIGQPGAQLALSTIVAVGSRGFYTNIPFAPTQRPCVINVIGNVIGGEAGGSVHGAGITIDAPATVNVTGRVIGGFNRDAGGVIGSAGIMVGNVSNFQINVVGSIEGSNWRPGIYINSNAIASIPWVNLVGNAIATNFVAIGNANGVSDFIVRYAGNLIYGPTGTVPIQSSFIINQSPNNSTVKYSRNKNGIGGDAYYTLANSNTTMPLPSAVRAGVRYNYNNDMGTCNMPSISAVSQGTRYDVNNSLVGISLNTPNLIFGTSVSALSSQNTIGDRLKKAATVETTGHLVASFSN